MAEEATQTDVTAVVNDAPVVEETTTEESSTQEQTVEQTTEELATPSEEVDENKNDSAESEVEEEQSEELAPKSENRFQKLANENRQLRGQIAQLEQLQVPTEEDYLEGGYDPLEARVNAMAAERQQEKAIAQVEQLNSAYDQDMMRIIHEYPQLNPKSGEYNEALAQKLFAQYDVDSGSQYTEDGIVLGTNQLPYSYIKDKMDLIGVASAQAKVAAQKNVEKMVAAAETPSSQAPVAQDDDSLEAMRERLSDVKF